MMTLRWKLSMKRWTKIHAVTTATAAVTACGREIDPANGVEVDPVIPGPVCEACAALAATSVPAAA